MSFHMLSMTIVEGCGARRPEGPAWGGVHGNRTGRAGASESAAWEVNTVQHV